MERLAAEGTVNALRTALTEATRAGSEQAERAASLYSRAEEQAGERAEERRVREETGRALAEEEHSGKVAALEAKLRSLSTDLSTAHAERERLVGGRDEDTVRGALERASRLDIEVRDLREGLRRAQAETEALGTLQTSAVAAATEAATEAAEAAAKAATNDFANKAVEAAVEAAAEDAVRLETRVAALQSEVAGKGRALEAKEAELMESSAALIGAKGVHKGEMEGLALLLREAEEERDRCTQVCAFFIHRMPESLPLFLTLHSVSTFSVYIQCSDSHSH